MEVKIKGRTYEYESDFPKGWKFSKGDSFKFPVVIGPEKCFIKRFEKHTEKITGWKLLQSLTGRTHDTLAKVYGTAGVVENNKIVHYVFFEFVEGQTLYDCVAEKTQLNLTKFTNDLFIAIQILQNNGHWFPDFCEKNIFCGGNGYFLLIDLDSAYPTSALPFNDMWGSKDYWVLVINFCIEFLQKKDFLPAHFHGASFNCLHAVFLILRLKIYYSIEDSDYDSPELFNQLPHYLNAISPQFSKLFNKVYQNNESPLTSYEIDEIKTMALNEITSLSARQVKEKLFRKPVADKPPVITDFRAHDYLEKKDGKYFVSSGNSFELKWEAEDATELKLYRNEEFYKTLGAHQKSLTLTEQVYDGSSKKIKYTLVAFNGNGKTEQSIIAEIVFEEKKELNGTPPQTEEDVVYYPAPDDLKIIDFSVKEYIEKKENHYIVESAQPFTLQWQTEHAEKTTLLRDGKPYQEISNGETSATAKETVYDGDARLVEYTLNISSNKALLELVETASVKIEVVYRQHITAFSLKNYTDKNAQYYTVESNKPFALQWTIHNAPKIKVLQNEEELKELNGDATSIETTVDNKDESDLHITYSLITYADDDSETSRKSLNVLVKPKPKQVVEERKPPKPLLYYILRIGAALIILLLILYFLFGRTPGAPKAAVSSVSTRWIDHKELIIVHGSHFPDNPINTDIFINETRTIPQSYSKDDSVVVKIPYNFSTPGNKDTVLVRVLVNNETIHSQYLQRIRDTYKTDTSDRNAEDTYRKMDTLTESGRLRDTMLDKLQKAIH